jgi:hypothetical protein
VPGVGGQLRAEQRYQDGQHQDANHIDDRDSLAARSLSPTLCVCDQRVYQVGKEDGEQEGDDRVASGVKKGQRAGHDHDGQQDPPGAWVKDWQLIPRIQRSWPGLLIVA